VLFGALLHAAWNALAKSGADPLVQTGLINLGCVAVALVLLPFLPFPAAPSWPCIAASSVLQLAYFALIAAAYRSGDMSLAYPLMRGTAPVLVALSSGVVLGERLSGSGWLGIGLVCGGVLATSFTRRRTRGQRRTIVLALTNAVVIACYTWVDGIGARLSGSLAAYTLTIILAPAVVLAIWIGRHHPRAFAEALRRRWAVGLGGAVCSLGSYGLALWAMTRAPIAPVAALRETAILFGLVLARLVLGERLTPGRALGGVLIAAGAVALRLA
jgi:drug/metabolite transporter (DMT)-like permease